MDTPRGLDEFNTLLNVMPLDAPLVAKMITLWRTELSVKYKRSFEDICSVLNERVLETILEKVKSKKLDAGDVRPVMARLVEGMSMGEATKIEKINDNDLEGEVRTLIKQKPGLRPNAYMGLVMAQFKGKLDAKKAMELITKIVG